MGTDNKYHDYAKRVKAAKKAAKGPEELRALEKRLVSEAEAEAEVEAYGKQKKE